MNRCELHTTRPECYTASWFLIRDQLLYWSWFQVPLIFISMLFDSLNLAKHRAIKRSRQFLSSPFVQITNGGLQFIGSFVVSFAWITRAGSLTVDFGAWYLESIFLILIIVSYIFRWLAAKSKTLFVLQLYCLFDILSITSHFSIPLTTVAEATEEDVVLDRYSWLDFGFLRSFILYAYFGDVFASMYKKSFYTQICMVTFKAACLIFFSAAVLFSLEYLGNIPGSDSFLLHVYECQDPVTQRFIRTNTVEGYANCSEGWSLLTAIYFMFVTISTVGYGDFSPATVLGRLVICVIIIVGIYRFANDTSHLVSIYDDQRLGRSEYSTSKDSSHVVVVGNPSTVQLKDFIREFYHPDHDPMHAGDSIPDIVVLIQFGLLEKEREFLEAMQTFVASTKKYRKRVFLLSGSPLDVEDLLRVRIQDAKAVFFLPNKYNRNGNAEDASNVLRLRAISRYKGKATELYVMVLNSDNTHLFEATGVDRAHIVASDGIKMGLMGLSCRCRGLSTLVSNLVCSRSSEVPAAFASIKWMQEYIAGASNEVYSCYLDERYVAGHATFLAVTQKLFQETSGQVLLVGMEDPRDRELHFNPGHAMLVTSSTKVYVIAESSTVLESLERQSVASEFVESTNLHVLRSQSMFKHFAERAQHNVERRIPKSVEKLIHLHQTVHSRGSPPYSVVENPHIIVCSNATSSNGQALARLRNFLRPLRAPHIERPLPVVLVDPHDFDQRAWVQLAAFDDVYHIRGSPLSHEVLQRAGIEHAKSIVVLAQGNETDYDDSKALFNTILIDSCLDDAQRFSLIELTDVENNKFLDPVQQVRANASMQRNSFRHSVRSLTQVRSFRSNTSQPHGFSNPILSQQTSIKSTKTTFAPVGPSTSTSTRYLKLLKEALNVMKNVMFNANQDDHDADDAIDAVTEDTNDSFYQERYVGGTLFPSFVADDLLIQSYFNPSLVHFVNQILDGESCFTLYELPASLQMPSDQPQLMITYGQVFHVMTSGASHALPIGILRAPNRDLQIDHRYVVTTPPADTIVYPNDQIFVIINGNALYRIAKTIQLGISQVRKWKRKVQEHKH